MRYSNTMIGEFVSRPNRFIAYVDVNGIREKCHVKNTGRCKELLIPGVKAVLSVADNPERSTKFDLVAVYKEDMLVNIDSQAPNKVIVESIHKIPGFEDVNVHPEYKYGNSRIDVFAYSGNRKILMEIKGVTLENNGLALFPDAPTERGLKHIRELEHSMEEGYEAYIMFLVQMRGPTSFSPNYEMHEEFAKEVKNAQNLGVRILAYDCVVTEDSISLGKPIDVEFSDHS